MPKTKDQLRTDTLATHGPGGSGLINDIEKVEKSGNGSGWVKTTFVNGEVPTQWYDVPYWDKEKVARTARAKVGYDGEAQESASWVSDITEVYAPSFRDEVVEHLNGKPRSAEVDQYLSYRINEVWEETRSATYTAVKNEAGGTTTTELWEISDVTVQVRTTTTLTERKRSDPI